MKPKTKTKITQAEYFQLVGLLTLASTYNEKIIDIVDAVMLVTGETDKQGFSADAVYGETSAEELMERLGITVTKRGAKK